MVRLWQIRYSPDEWENVKAADLTAEQTTYGPLEFWSFDLRSRQCTLISPRVGELRVRRGLTWIDGVRIIDP